MRSAAAFVVLTLAGCCGAPPAPEPPVVRGTVRFDGELPKRRLFNTSGFPAAPEGGIPREVLVVGERGGVRWAFVYIRHGLEGKAFGPPASPVLLEISGFRYQPHVLGLQVGQTLEIHNRDRQLHHPHLPDLARGRAPPVPPAPWRVVFGKSEVMFKLACDVHPWMTAWVGVLDHPFFAVTDAEGKFELKNLPPGKYTLGVWHETLAPEEREITVGDIVEVTFTLKKR